jgi:predicted nucleic acid-binding protein
VILVDTSIWVDHLRANDPALAALLDRGQVLSHPFVTGEVALGYLRQRSIKLGALAELPEAVLATPAEVMQFIESHTLWGTGIGLVDAHLLVSTRLTPDAKLWTRDRRLSGVAEDLGLARP